MARELLRDGLITEYTIKAALPLSLSLSLSRSLSHSSMKRFVITATPLFLFPLPLQVKEEDMTLPEGGAVRRQALDEQDSDEEPL